MDPFVTRPSAASALTLRIRHHKCAQLAALACKKSSLAYKVNPISFSNFLLAYILYYKSYQLLPILQIAIVILLPFKRRFWRLLQRSFEYSEESKVETVLYAWKTMICQQRHLFAWKNLALEHNEALRRALEQAHYVRNKKAVSQVNTCHLVFTSTINIPVVR